MQLDGLFADAKVHIFSPTFTASYRILPHLTASYRNLLHSTASYRILPIEGPFAVARTANDRITNGKQSDKCKKKLSYSIFLVF